MNSQLLVCWPITLGCFYHGKDSALFYGNRYTGYCLLPKLPSMGLEKALLIILIFYIAFNWAICFTLNAMWQWAHEYTLLVLPRFQSWNTCLHWRLNWPFEIGVTTLVYVAILELENSPLGCCICCKSVSPK